MLLDDVCQPKRQRQRSFESFSAWKALHASQPPRIMIQNIQFQPRLTAQILCVFPSLQKIAAVCHHRKTFIRFSDNPSEKHSLYILLKSKLLFSPEFSVGCVGQTFQKLICLFTAHKALAAFLQAFADISVCLKPHIPFFTAQFQFFFLALEPFAVVCKRRHVDLFRLRKLVLQRLQRLLLGNLFCFYFL